MGCTCCHKKAPACVRSQAPKGIFYCKFCSDHFPLLNGNIRSELYAWGSNSCGEVYLFL